MVSHFHEQESLRQNSIFDSLYCEEDRFDDVLSGGFGLKEPEIEDLNAIHGMPFTSLFEHDLFWVDEELVALFSKEKKQAKLSFEEINSDGHLKMLRNEAMKWMSKVTGHYGFTAMTAVLAMNYYDRFISSPCFQKDKPWMSQLAAVACLSIAAKVEETQAPPLLVDLQVEESKYLFEAKTIQRMELLVLSTLQWKMNPVTPISFFDHTVRRLKLITNLHWDFMGKCESVVLSMITDYRLVRYPPSVIASAIMIFVIGKTEPRKAVEFENQLMSLLKPCKENVIECLELITEMACDQVHNQFYKRKHSSLPSSPCGVVDAYFSSDSSNDSWAVSSFDTLSPEPMLKRIRTQDQT